MLTLTRRVDEIIYIGDDIKIKVVYLDRGKVRLAIEAPKEVLILRGELRKPTDGEQS